MKWSEIRFWGIFFGFLLGALPLLAQDVLPEKSRPDRHSGHGHAAADALCGSQQSDASRL